MHALLQWIHDEVTRHGYLVVGLVVACESAGAPLPGETVLLLAAFLARQEHLSIVAVIAIAAAAAIIGDNVGYWIGRRGGRPVVQRWGRYVLLTPPRVERCERFFARHGGKAVFLARWSAGLRVAGAWIAGMSHMSWSRFLVWNALGGIAWALAVGAAGYALGASYQVAARYFSGLGLVLVALVGVWLAWRGLRHLGVGPFRGRG